MTLFFQQHPRRFEETMVWIMTTLYAFSRVPQIHHFCNFASIFFGPIFLYSLSALTHLISVPFKGKASFFEARLAFFWAMIVAAPLLLLVAVVQGLVPGGLFSQVFQCIAMVAYAWIYSTIFCSAERFSSNKPLFFLLSFGYLYLSYVVT